jgi:hypothetical protein
LHPATPLELMPCGVMEGVVSPIRLRRLCVWRFRVSAIRQDVPQELHTVVGHADGLTTAPPMLVADDGTNDAGNLR